jgi:iron(III) transport system substrate-binding protein
MALFTNTMCLVLVVAAVAGASPASAQDTSLLKYSGPDRQQKLIAAAQKEGSFTLYTSIAAKDHQALVAPFEKKYGIKVKLWRSSSVNVLRRTVTENAAKRYEVDAIYTDTLKMEALHRENLLQPVNSPYLKDLIPGAVPAHHEWAASMLSVWVQAYNTNLVKKEDLPKTYQDLLDPKWKGKLGIEAKIPEWYSTVVTDMGEENGVKLFQNIVARNGISVRHGLSVLNNLVVAGEVPLAITVFSYMPAASKREGAPIDWFALEPVAARGNGMGIARHAAHPNAALLFYDYMLTEEAQKLLVGLDYVPTNSAVPSPLGKLRIKMIDPVSSLDQIEKWTTSYEDVVLKGARKN